MSEQSISGPSLTTVNINNLSPQKSVKPEELNSKSSFLGHNVRNVSIGNVSKDLRQKAWSFPIARAWWSYGLLPNLARGAYGVGKWVYSAFSSGEKNSQGVQEKEETATETATESITSERNSSVSEEQESVSLGHFSSSIIHADNNRESSQRNSNAFLPSGIRNSVWGKLGYYTSPPVEHIDTNRSSIGSNSEKEKKDIPSKDAENLPLKQTLEVPINQFEDPLITSYSTLDSLFKRLGDVSTKIQLSEENRQAFQKAMIEVDVLLANYQRTKKGDNFLQNLGSLQRVALRLQEAYGVLDGVFLKLSKEVKGELKLINNELDGINQKFFEMNMKKETVL